MPACRDDNARSDAVSVTGSLRPCQATSVSKSERRSWQRLVEGYLATRRSLGTSVLLQDLRRDVSEDETDLVDWLLEREIPVLIALTKIDKLKPMRRAERIRIVRSQFAEVCVVATSAETGDGIAELWREILRTVADS